MPSAISFLQLLLFLAVGQILSVHLPRGPAELLHQFQPTHLVNSKKTHMVFSSLHADLCPSLQLSKSSDINLAALQDLHGERPSDYTLIQDFAYWYSSNPSSPLEKTIPSTGWPKLPRCSSSKAVEEELLSKTHHCQSTRRKLIAFQLFWQDWPSFWPACQEATGTGSSTNHFPLHFTAKQPLILYQSTSLITVVLNIVLQYQKESRTWSQWPVSLLVILHFKENVLIYSMQQCLKRQHCWKKSSKGKKTTTQTNKTKHADISK